MVLKAVSRALSTGLLALRVVIVVLRCVKLKSVFVGELVRDAVLILSVVLRENV